MTSNEREPAKRRIPQQIRSKDRVERILHAAARSVVDGGVDAVSTRAVAVESDVPVATLYQYFADKDEILIALVERGVAEMDAAVTTDLGRLEPLSVRGIMETTMRAFVDVFHRHPAFTVLWLRGRTNKAIQDFCREHNRRVASELFRFAEDASLLDSTATLKHAHLAAEVGDRVLELAFATSLTADEEVLGEGIGLVASYLERYAAE